MNSLYKQFPLKDSLYDPPISTFEPTKKENNVDNINTIPGSDICYFDCRIMPDYSLNEVKLQIEKFKKEIEKKFDVKMTLSYPQCVEAPDPTPADAPVAKSIQKAVYAVMRRRAKTIGIGGGTVAAFFREVGLSAVCWCTLDDTLHAPNEYCIIDNVINDAKVFAHIFLQK
jgi:succinyl-diaminopimelate desuccinylase